jgi:hypothetical protein
MLQLAELPVLAHTVWTRRQSRRVRGERELEHWFGARRTLLPLISLRAGDGRSTLAAGAAAVPVATVFNHR